MGEIWKDVVGFEELYEVSNMMTVRNKETLYELTKFKKGGKGSLYVGLTKNGQTHSQRVKTIHHRAFEVKPDDLEGEVWVDIANYSGAYQVSSCGRVRSVDRNIQQRNEDGYVYNRFMQGRVLSLNRTNGSGYHIVTIKDGCNDNTIGNEYIHILVAKHFIPNTDNKPEVNHIDGNKSNNCADNLEWVTRQENVTHAVANNLGNMLEKRKIYSLKGEDNPNTNLLNREALEIYDLAQSKIMSMPKIAQLYKVNTHVVCNIKHKKSWKYIHSSTQVQL